MAGLIVEWQLAGRPALVVGLGAVGRRRAAALAAAGAHVLAVDPRADQPGFDPPPGVEILAEPYRASHLRGSDSRTPPALVVAAATPTVNRRVVADARRRGLPVCSASDPDASDFTMPAVWNSGGLAVAISTAGASPALARTLRDRIRDHLGDNPGTFAALLASLRPTVRRRLTDPSARRRLLTAWGQPHWLDFLARWGPEATRKALLDELDRAATPPS